MRDFFLLRFFRPTFVANFMLDRDEIEKSKNFRRFYPNFTETNSRKIRRKFQSVSNPTSKHFTRVTLYHIVALLIAAIMIIRVGIVIFLDRKFSLQAKLFGSIFELVHANRVHSEMAVLEYSLHSFATSILIFVIPKTRLVFKLVIVYCNQFLVGQLVKNPESTKVHHNPLPKDQMVKLTRRLEFILRIFPIVIAAFFVNVLLTAASIFYFADPKINELLEFFGGDQNWAYFFHAGLILRVIFFNLL